MNSIPEILYEDPHLLICRKPTGILAESDGKGSGLPDLICSYLQSHGESGEIHTVHRLDRPVGGLTVMAKTSDCAGKLSVQIENRKVEKEYLAVLRGIPAEKEALLQDLLFRDSHKGKTYVVNRQRKGVREASLDYRLLSTVLWEGEPLSLVQVRLHTGRTHQIRVQFASRKLPLYGDGRYGSRDGGDLPALFAWYLGLKHPYKKKTIRCHCLPDTFPFTLFQSDIDSLYSTMTQT